MKENEFASDMILAASGEFNRGHGQNGPETARKIERER
ncbi:protein of unknown function [Pseudodesulfovibrio profundus]|uniref:Uncharacterized protein n=1 Tax=Pseudodesulfovibrio profundus TaxID=57320 RepID=A0A2C8FDW0_9BACT|nr:protein of unknown function [Pseudodesulfovibrio profundus]